jgi:hypothetical protein
MAKHLDPNETDRKLPSLKKKEIIPGIIISEKLLGTF